MLCALAYRLRGMDSAPGWAVAAGLYGLAFGALCAPVYLFTSGPGGALAWWIAGLPTDIVHCLGNFVITLLAYRPLRRALHAVAARP